MNEGGPPASGARSYRTHACDPLVLPHVVPRGTQGTTSGYSLVCLISPALGALR